MRPDKRKRAYRKGIRAEWIAAFYLLVKGYRLVERRHRNPAGEIDLIVRRGDLVGFVEVKARRDEQAALDSIGYEAQRRIERAGEFWLTGNGLAQTVSWRFDVIAVLPWRWPQHFEDVW